MSWQHRFPILFFAIFCLLQCNEPTGFAGKDIITRIDSLNNDAFEKVHDIPDTVTALLALELSLQNNYYAGAGMAYNTLGLAEKQFGEYGKSFQYFKSALSYKRKTSDSISVGKTLRNLGDLYRNAGLSDDAFESFSNSRQVFESGFSGEKNKEYFSNKGYLFFGLAKSAILKKMDFAEINQFYDTAYHNFQLANDTVGLIKLDLGKGSFYVNANENEKAKAYYFNAIKYSEEKGYPFGKAFANHQLGILYYNEENDSAAIVQFRKALPYFEKTNSIDKVFDINRHLCLLDYYEGKTTKAFKDANKLIQPVFKTEKRFADKENAANLYADFYKTFCKKENNKKRRAILLDSVLYYKDQEVMFIKAQSSSPSKMLANSIKDKQLLGQRERAIKAEEKAHLFTFFSLLGTIAALAFFFMYYQSKKQAEAAAREQELKEAAAAKEQELKDQNCRASIRSRRKCRSEVMQKRAAFAQERLAVIRTRKIGTHLRALS